MSFGAPLYLLLLTLAPLALAAYVASRRRATRYAVRFTAAPALRLAAGTERAWRRHLPAAAVLAAVLLLALASARPQRTVARPLDRATIMLVTDHSRSMLATDVEPDRMTAAKRAARSFLGEVPDRVRVGAVAFSDVPDTVEPPSTEREAVRAIVDGLVADGATATGDALQAALDGLPKDRRAGGGTPGAIVLLSDGRTTVGRDPVEIAREARRLRVPIFTISLGTSDATVPNPGLGPPLPATPDPETLEQIARVSGGRSFAAEDDQELSSIYERLGSRLGTKRERRDVTAAFAAGGLVLLLGGAAGSVRSGGRLP